MQNHKVCGTDKDVVLRQLKFISQAVEQACRTR